MIGPEDQARWRPWLLPSERLLWVGRPRLGFAPSRGDLASVLFFLLWAGVIAVQHQRTMPPGHRLSLGPFSLFFLLLAFSALVGRFLVDIVLRRRLFYAVTDRRVLVLRSGRFPGLKSSDAAYLPMLDVHEERSGRGTLSFDSVENPAGWLELGTQTFSPALHPGIRFFRIESARAVYDLVCTQAARRRREIAGELPPDRAFIG